MLKHEFFLSNKRSYYSDFCGWLIYDTKRSERQKGYSTLLTTAFGTTLDGIIVKSTVHPKKYIGTYYIEWQFKKPCTQYYWCKVVNLGFGFWKCLAEIHVWYFFQSNEKLCQRERRRKTLLWIIQANSKHHYYWKNGHDDVTGDLYLS